MIGGMVSSTVLTLVVIPAIYGLIEGMGLKADAGRGRERTDVGGTEAMAAVGD